MNRANLIGYSITIFILVLAFIIPNYSIVSSWFYNDFIPFLPQLILIILGLSFVCVIAVKVLYENLWT
jgi:hypothetical protein